MSEPLDSSIQELAVNSLHQAIRHLSARILEDPGSWEVEKMRRVERLMRIAIALAGAGNGIPWVEVHGIPAKGGPGDWPEILSVTLTDLLEARAADHLPGALQGDPEALRELARVAERLLEAEDIQLV